MRLGVQIPVFNLPGGSAALRDQLKTIVQTVDQGGFYSLWVMDHFFQIDRIGPVELYMLEGYSTLSYFAGLTEKVKLGTMVTGVIYRYPGILVKTVNTLDVLSGGRAYLGIGAAWYEREAKGLGVPFPELKERFERLEETLQIAGQMWSGEVKPYDGKYYHLAETLSSPQPLSKPHPPILIGGAGEKKTLRLVAKYADACNLFMRMGTDELKGKLDTLKRHCDEVGRPYSAIEKTSLGTILPAMQPGDLVAECRAAAGLGFQHAIYNIADVENIPRILDMVVKHVLPEVSGL